MAFALKLLGLRSHSREEIQRKLVKKRYDQEEIDAAMERLVEQGLVDDRTFSMELIRSRSRQKPSGKLKLRAELQKRGVAETIIDDLLKEYESTELCQKAAEKKIASLRGGTDKERRQKLVFFLQSRGFAWQEIQLTLKRLGAAESHDEEPFAPSSELTMDE